MNVLITGGTGLVGKVLAPMLQEKGYTVRFLSRQKSSSNGIKTYQWDITKRQIETEAVVGVDYIIHLAGAGVAEKRWTLDYKKEIVESRVVSTDLLASALQLTGSKPKAFISASAVGIYGLDTQETLLTENSPKGNGFLADVTEQWEKSVEQITQMGIRTALMRIGIVLAGEGGALPKIMQPIRFLVGSPLGSGRQYMSWIHIRDVAKMFIYVLENEQISGAYNAVGNHPITNEDFTKAVALAMNKLLLLPNIPAFVLKMMLGEMAGIALGGNKVSNEKIVQAGFQYEFATLDQALKDLI